MNGMHGRIATQDEARSRRQSPGMGDGEAGSTSGGHVIRHGEIDVSHKVILYLEDITVAFDGFKALNALACRSMSVNCARSSDRTVPARPR
jgi:hypothetical protein